MKYEITIFDANNNKIVWQNIIEGDTKERVAMKAENLIKAAGIKGVMRTGKTLSNTDKRRYTFKMKQIDDTISKAFIELKEEGSMRAYIDSLESADEKYSEAAWREIISKEIDDIKSQDPDAEMVDIDEVIKALDADGYITE